MVVRDGDFVLVHHHRVLFPSSLSRKTRRNTPRNARIGAAVVTFFVSRKCCVCEESQSCSSSRIVVACWCLLCFGFEKNFFVLYEFRVLKCEGEREKYSPRPIPPHFHLLRYVRVVIFLYHARHHKHTYHLSLSLSHRRVVFADVLSFSLLSPKKTNRRVSAFF